MTTAILGVAAYLAFSTWVAFVALRRWRQSGDRSRRDIENMMRTTNAADEARGRPLTYPGVDTPVRFRPF